MTESNDVKTGGIQKWNVYIEQKEDTILYAWTETFFNLWSVVLFWHNLKNIYCYGCKSVFLNVSQLQFWITTLVSILSTSASRVSEYSLIRHTIYTLLLLPLHESMISTNFHLTAVDDYILIWGKFTTKKSFLVPATVWTLLWFETWHLVKICDIII
jgi:hypothetical protein